MPRPSSSSSSSPNAATLWTKNCFQCWLGAAIILTAHNKWLVIICHPIIMRVLPSYSWENSGDRNDNKRGTLFSHLGKRTVSKCSQTRIEWHEICFSIMNAFADLLLFGLHSAFSLLDFFFIFKFILCRFNLPNEWTCSGSILALCPCKCNTVLCHIENTWCSRNRRERACIRCTMQIHTATFFNLQIYQTFRLF